MVKIRITYPISPELNHDCDLMHIANYELEEVMLLATEKEQARKAIRIVINGRNFRAVAQHLHASVGKIPVSYLRISPDQRSIEGILLKEPEAGSYVDVILGDQDAVRHPTPLDPTKIKRIVTKIR